MSTSISDPLQADESYMVLLLDADDAIGTMTPSQIRILALNEAIRRADANGMEITRGPEILEYHHPQYPGDQTWVKTVAIGRPRPV